MSVHISITDALEIKAGHHYVLAIDALITAQAGEYALKKLRERFPGSKFALVPPKGSVMELPKPLNQGEPHAVRQNDLVAALKRVAEAFPPHTETHHVLTLLARELVDPKATSGYAYGRPVVSEMPDPVAGKDYSSGMNESAAIDQVEPATPLTRGGAFCQRVMAKGEHDWLGALDPSGRPYTYCTFCGVRK